jgi:hypothetical protein
MNPADSAEPLEEKIGSTARNWPIVKMLGSLRPSALEELEDNYLLQLHYFREMEPPDYLGD